MQSHPQDLLNQRIANEDIAMGLPVDQSGDMGENVYMDMMERLMGMSETERAMNLPMYNKELASMGADPIEPGDVSLNPDSILGAEPAPIDFGTSPGIGQEVSDNMQHGLVYDGPTSVPGPAPSMWDDIKEAGGNVGDAAMGLGEDAWAAAQAINERSLAEDAERERVRQEGIGFADEDYVMSRPVAPPQTEVDPTAKPPKRPKMRPDTPGGGDEGTGTTSMTGGSGDPVDAGIAEVVASGNDNLWEGVFGKGGSGWQGIKANWKGMSQEKKQRIYQAMVAMGGTMMSTPGNFGEGFGKGANAGLGVYMDRDDADFEENLANRKQAQSEEASGLNNDAKRMEISLLREQINDPNRSETQRLEASNRLKTLQIEQKILESGQLPSSGKPDQSRFGHYKRRMDELVTITGDYAEAKRIADAEFLGAYGKEAPFDMTGGSDRPPIGTLDQ